MSIPVIDHLVLPVDSLLVARERWTRLGFTVARDALHPFGTANACIFLKDGTYLEPLAIGDEALAAQCQAQGNSFVERDALFRKTLEKEGFSAFVLRSPDADADDVRFHFDQIVGGQRLDFSRTAIGDDGSEVAASFRLAFADLGSPQFFAFTCQRVNAALPTSGKAVEHPNGVVGLDAILLKGGRADNVRRLRSLLQTEPLHADGKEAFELANCSVVLSDNEAEPNRELAGFGIRFRVLDLNQTRKHLRSASIPCHEEGNRLFVTMTSGQGCVLEFTE